MNLITFLASYTAPKPGAPETFLPMVPILASTESRLGFQIPRPMTMFWHAGYYWIAVLNSSSIDSTFPCELSLSAATFEISLSWSRHPGQRTAGALWKMQLKAGGLRTVFFVSHIIL